MAGVASPADCPPPINLYVKISRFADQIEEYRHVMPLTDFIADTDYFISNIVDIRMYSVMMQNYGITTYRMGFVDLKYLLVPSPGGGGVAVRSSYRFILYFPVVSVNVFTRY